MEIVLIQADDWEGIYIDGELIEQSHRISAALALQSLLRVGRDYVESVKIVEADEDWMESEGYLPAKLIDCVLVKEEGED